MPVTHGVCVRDEMICLTSHCGYVYFEICLNHRIGNRIGRLDLLLHLNCCKTLIFHFI